MKIVLVLDFENKPGGAERRIVRVFNAISEVHEVVLIARRANRSVVEERFACMGVKPSSRLTVRAYPMKGKLRDSFSCLLGIIGEHPDVVLLSDDCGFNRLASRVLKLWEIPLLFVVAYGLYADVEAIKKRNRGFEALVSRASVVDVLYPWQESFYRELLSDGAEVSVTPGTFTDLHIIKPRKKENLIVMFSARLEAFKGTELLVRACSLCATDLRDRGYTVVICGDGDERSHLEGLISGEGIEDIVQLPGYQLSADWFPRARIACNVPPDVSNYPSQTLAEAIASGCLIVATNTPYSYRMVDPSFSILANPDPEAVARAIRKLIELSNEDQCAASLQARAFAEDRFSMEPFIAYYLSLVERAANKLIGKKGV